MPDLPAPRQAWRMVKEKYAPTAFSGEGAAKVGGRWNSRGTWVVYASATRSLAALETLVHLNPPVHFRHVIFSIEFDPSLVEPLTDPPKNWRDEPAPPSTQHLGDTWARELRTPILELPSVLIPGESNFLLNPAHPPFREITISPPVPFTFDPRLCLC